MVKLVIIFYCFCFRYFVFISKYYEGYINWNLSVVWNWNLVDVGFYRNIVGEC